jgi:hypothetical protein
MTAKTGGRKVMGISLPETMYLRVQSFGNVNWSAVCRGAIEQKLQILESEGDEDRRSKLRKMFAENSKEVQKDGYLDGLNYPIENLDFRALYNLVRKAEPLIEDSDPVNIVAVLDETRSFKLKQNSWEYKVGFIEGLMRLYEIAGMSEATYQREKKLHEKA